MRIRKEAVKLQVINPYHQEICHEVSCDEGAILEDDNPINELH
jgi:hypothetical protein